MLTVTINPPATGDPIPDTIVITVAEAFDGDDIEVTCTLIDETDPDAQNQADLNVPVTKVSASVFNADTTDPSVVLTDGHYYTVLAIARGYSAPSSTGVVTLDDSGSASSSHCQYNAGDE